MILEIGDSQVGIGVLVVIWRRDYCYLGVVVAVWESCLWKLKEGKKYCSVTGRILGKRLTARRFVAFANAWNADS